VQENQDTHFPRVWSVLGLDHRVDPGLKRIGPRQPPCLSLEDINGGNLFAVGCNAKGRRKGSWWLRLPDTGVYSIFEPTLHFGLTFARRVVSLA
jgi:hypothetical protein